MMEQAVMPTSKKAKLKPDPVRPGDEVIVREEIEAYYTQR